MANFHIQNNQLNVIKELSGLIMFIDNLYIRLLNAKSSEFGVYDEMFISQVKHMCNLLSSLE